MLATISSRMPTDLDSIWAELQRSRTLRRISAPVLTFAPLEGHDLPERWEVGIRYPLRLSAFGVVPLGDHVIEIVRIDRAQGLIESREQGRLARTWNHRIELRQIGPGTVEYTDEVEIEAGLLTPAVWAFAHAFYRHRQRNWRRLLATGDHAPPAPGSARAT